MQKEALALVLKWKILNRKTFLDEGKETSNPKEERRDPFLCRKEKNTFLKATNIAVFTLIRYSCLWLHLLALLVLPPVVLLPLATLPVLLFFSSTRQRDRN